MPYREATFDNACPCCGDRLASVICDRARGSGEYGYVRCCQCGMGRITPPPPAPEALYDAGYFRDGGLRAGYSDYESDERWHRRTARARLTRLDRFVSRRGQLIDVGTALGYLPEEAHRVGFQASGVEVSDWAAQKTRARGIRVERTLEHLQDLAGAVDVITFYQVLEHIPDLRAQLAQATALLRPGGVVVCETWDVASRTARVFGSRWQQLSAPSVLWLFEQGSMHRLLTESGLQPVSWRRTPKTVSAATVFGQVFESEGGIAERLTRPVVSKLPVPYFLDDLVTFVARKS